MEFTTPIYKTKTKAHIAFPALQKLLIVPEGFKKPALVSSVLGPCPSGNLVLTQLIYFSRTCTEGSTQAGRTMGLGQVAGVCLCPATSFTLYKSLTSLSLSLSAVHLALIFGCTYYEGNI